MRRDPRREHGARTLIYVDQTIPWELCDEERRALLRVAWGGGRLDYKLDVSQAEVYAQIRACFAEATTSSERIFGLDIGRRWGKSTLMVAVATETCIRVPGCTFPYGAPTQKAVRELLVPLMERLISDCPPAMRPEWRVSESAWVFPNGSRLRMVGLDLHPDRLRGVGIPGACLDEFGFTKQARYIMDSIVRPMMLTEPDAFLLAGSTPPVSPGHYWSTHLLPELKAADQYAHRTIEDCPRITDREREAAIEKLGGRQATRCQREYFAMHVLEETKAIVPEWPGAKAACVREWPQPDYLDAYEAMDPGHVNDLWAILFAYYDFLEAKLIVVDELQAQRQTTNALAGMIHGVERRLEWAQVHKRVSDTDMQVIRDLRSDHGLKFVPTRKDDKTAALNNLRRWIQEGRIIIHPRCTHLIAHLDFGVWKDSTSQRDRSFEYTEEWGHFDFIDALIYLVRNVDERRNPYPTIHETHDPSKQVITPGHEEHRGAVNAARAMVAGPARRGARQRGSGIPRP